MNEIVSKEKEKQIIDFVRYLVGSYVLQPKDLIIHMDPEKPGNVVMFPAKLDYGKVIGERGIRIKALKIVLKRFGKVIGIPVTTSVSERSELQSANPPLSEVIINEDWTSQEIKPLIKFVLTECEMEHLRCRIQKDPLDPNRSHFAFVGYYRLDDYKRLEAISLRYRKYGVPLPEWLLKEAEEPGSYFYDDIDWTQDLPDRVRRAKAIIEEISEDVLFGISFQTLLSGVAVVQGHRLTFDADLMEEKP